MRVTKGAPVSIMEWSSQLDIGVDEMNHQHQVLLDLMNDLHNKWERKESRLVLGEALTKLKLATVEHFREEEEFQEKIGWSKLDTHKMIHKRLLDKFGSLEEEFKKTGELGEPFFHFLRFWLSSHIQGIDKEYAAFSNGAKASA